MKKMLLLLIPAAFMIQSCNKGCTDANATNYSADAKKDDGNCQYQATLTLWFEQSKTIAWDQSGVTSLNIYVGEVLVGGGNNNVNTYWVTAPDCAEAGTINVLKNLGTSATKDIQWQVKDQDDVTLESGTWSASGGACDVIKVE